MDAKSTADKGTKRIEEHAYGNQRKGDPCYVAEESLVESCMTVMWKAELVSGENGYLAELSK